MQVVAGRFAMKSMDVSITISFRGQEVCTDGVLGGRTDPPFSWGFPHPTPAQTFFCRPAGLLIHRLFDGIPIKKPINAEVRPTKNVGGYGESGSPPSNIELGV